MFIQHATGYTLTCDNCGVSLRKEGETVPFESASLLEVTALAREYGWTVGRKVHKCTYCKTFKR